VLGRLLAAALLAGLLAGLLASAVQGAFVLPLIHQAEGFEHGATHAHDGGSNEWTPAGGFERSAFTVLFNLLAGIGFALLLVATYALRGEVDWRRGLLWGLGGFAAFALAPSLGLPPELPGMASAELGARQAWWISTALGTALGLALLVFGRRALVKGAGLVLIVAPHLIGAPHPEIGGGTAPAELAAAFVGASLAANLLFWLSLGAITGYAFSRWVAPPARG
jgi:cobalt transporter subunit CbtA